MRIRNHRLECRLRIAGWTMWALCVVPRSIQALTMLRWPSSHRVPFAVTTNQNRQVHPSTQHWVTRAHSSDTMTVVDVPNCTSDGTDAPPDEATEPASSQSFVEGTIEDTFNATAPLCTPVPTNATSRRSRKKQLPVPPLPTPDDFAAADYAARSFFRFELRHVSARSGARVGRLHTPHGVIDTPAFVAVATNGALKGVDFRQLPQAAEAQEQLIFCNTYHLLIQPGAAVIGAAGGIHAFTKRNGPFITDSGGFQVFSLAYGSVAEDLASKGELKRSNSGKYSHNGQLSGADAVQVTEDGAIFRSYRDGSKLLLTPETTVQAQKLIGADIIIPLDELPGYYVDRERLVESVARTHRWEARSLQEHLKDVKNQAMYCVIHGGMDRELRKQSVDYLTSLPFDGYGIGGSLGNGRAELQELLTWLMPMFNINERIASKPRHLLGIADEESIRNAIPLGLDTFDSCYPTRLGRHGTVLTRQGLLRLPSGTHARSFGMKIDAACTCSTCQTYDRAYLCHLFKANEPIAINLASIHNIHYMYDLMAQLRQDILDDKI